VIANIQTKNDVAALDFVVIGSLKFSITNGNKTPFNPDTISEKISKCILTCWGNLHEILNFKILTLSLREPVLFSEKSAQGIEISLD